MENIIYKAYDADSALAENVNKIEFYCCQTSDLNLTRDIRELGICISDSKDLQVDFSLDCNELKSLVKYLSDLLEYNEQFNKNSKPEE